MKKLFTLLCVLIFPILSKSQNIAVGGNTVDQSYSFYETNSPTNTYGNRIELTFIKKTEWHFRQNKLFIDSVFKRPYEPMITGGRMAWFNPFTGELKMTDKDSLKTPFSSLTGVPFTSTNISQWNTAYGWGNHASAGYLLASDTTGKWLNKSYVPTWLSVSGKPTFSGIATSGISAGMGISVSSGSIISNIMPDQIVTMSGIGSSSVTGTYPTFTVSTPTIATKTSELLNDAGFTSTPATSITASGATVAQSGSSFTVSVPAAPQVSITAAGATTVTGTSPSFTVSTPAPITYTAGTGISILGTTITNSSPNQTVAVSGPLVTGSYPNYTVSAAPQTSITAAGAATVTGTAPNYTVNAPAPITYTAGGTGLSITGNTITNTAPDRTVTLTGSVVSGSYPNYTITSVPQTSITAAGSATITGTAPNYTLSTPATVTYTAGAGISVSGTTITNTAPNQTVSITGSGLTTISGTYPNFTVSTPTSVPGYIQGDKGTAVLSAVALQTSYTVTHGLSYTPSIIVIQPTNANSAIISWISNKTSTSFTVNFVSVPAIIGLNTINFDWIAYR